ncbi:MAG: H-NS histone family protein [Methylococcaceae bacterium]
MSEFEKLSENELEVMIENARKALELLQVGKRKEVIAQIKELAASINMAAELIDLDKKPARKGVSVPFKYRHPDDASKQWTGRGVAPKWMQDLISNGHTKADFKI